MNFNDETIHTLRNDYWFLFLCPKYHHLPEILVNDSHCMIYL